MDKHQTSRPAARGWIMAATLATALGATALTGVSMAADSSGAGTGRGWFGHGQGHGRHGPVDAATADKHIARMVDRIVGDGTAQQKARLAEIAKSAFADLQGVKAETRAAHARAHTLLMQPAIDRAALEQLRAEQIARMDKTSRRLLTALEDAAEVLTPEQRQRFAEHLKRRMR